MAENLEETDLPQLSSETFKILLQAIQVFQPSDVKQFEENWQLSQFWYDENTATKLAAECVRQVSWSCALKA